MQWQRDWGTENVKEKEQRQWVIERKAAKHITTKGKGWDSVSGREKNAVRKPGLSWRLQPLCQYATSLESCCLMSAGSSLPPAVSSHLLLLVSHFLFFYSVSSHISLSVSVHLTMAVVDLCLTRSLWFPSSLCVSVNLLSVTEVMTTIRECLLLILSLPNSTALSLSLCSSCPVISQP